MILLKSLYEEILSPVTSPLRWLLEHIHSTTGLAWGWSIIVLTVIVRIALVPMTVKQQQSMRRMQAIQPEIKKLQKKYEHDKQLLNQKMMEYYRENKVNPFASCLPLLAQMPVFLGLFVLLRNTKGFIHEGDDKSVFFGTISDITVHLDKLPTITLVLLMVVYVGSQIGATLLMPSSVDPRQKYLFAALPIVFAFFVINANFPTGLMLYWVTTNLWTVGQAAVIRKWFPPPMPVAPAAAGTRRKPPEPDAPAKSGEPRPRRPRQPESDAPRPRRPRPAAPDPAAKRKPKGDR